MSFGGPPAADDGALQQFLLQLGSALTAAGEAVNEVQDHLRAVALAYGADEARFVVLPTFLVVALDPRRPATLEPTSQLNGVLRLDQTSALFDILDRALKGDLDPAEGSRLVLEAISRPPHYRLVFLLLGYAVLTAGLSLILQPSGSGVVLAAGFGLLVGVLNHLARRSSVTQTLLPVAAAFLVSALTFLLADLGWANANLKTMVAPLITFLPGAALTMAVIELSSAQMVSGASRLVSGALQLVLLAFGIVTAAEAFGVPVTEILVEGPALAPWWIPWLGVVVFGIGIALFNSAPSDTLPGLFLVLLVAFLGQQVGSEFLGVYVGGLVGALLMTVTARLIERTRFGPPALVSFLPGFWLLVPGALGLIGLTEYIASGPDLAVQSLVGTLGAMVAIAIGVLCGYLLVETFRPLYRHAVRPALDLLPFQLIPPTGDRIEDDAVEGPPDEA
ncbi:MAG TPA: threonine/serine exporter family protein [Acidimicrobiia bacterium]|nr:threonine/serine exporter family protein [Acidimicrobiia bacterium]